MTLYLQLETGLFSGEEVALLHFAPEGAIDDLLSACPNIRYESADLEPGCAMHVIDMTKIPRRDATFDYVLVTHVLEHIPDDRAAMAELLRILRPGGKAILQHPVDYRQERTYEDWTLTSPEQRQAAFLQEDHVRIYGRDLADRLKSIGFVVNVRRFREELPTTERVFYCLDEGSKDDRSDDIYECAKPDQPGRHHA